MSENVKPAEEQVKAKKLSAAEEKEQLDLDRKSTRLNSSHSQISYAVFCLKKKSLARRGGEYAHRARSRPRGGRGGSRGRGKARETKGVRRPEGSESRVQGAREAIEYIRPE